MQDRRALCRQERKAFGDICQLGANDVLEYSSGTLARYVLLFSQASHKGS